MRLECPNCHAVFEVPDALAQKARVLRCANCDHCWSPALGGAMAGEVGAETSGQKPALEDPAPVSAPPEMSRAVKEMSERAGLSGAPMQGAGLRSRNGPSAVSMRLAATEMQANPSGGMGWAVAWVLSVAAVGGAGFALWHWRDSLGHLWPMLGH